MSTWLAALIPVSAFTIVLLLGFVGCNYDFDQFGKGGDGPPEGGSSPYAELVLSGKPIGYWRLDDGEDTATARDEIGIDAAHPTGLHPGAYNQGTPLPADTDSDAAPGTLGFAAAGLLTNDPAKCVDFDGGYVEITHDGSLNTWQFTIEAWVHPAWAQGDPSYRVIAGSYDYATAVGYVLVKNTNDYFEIVLGLGTNGIAPALVGDTSFQKGKDETYHLAATYDGATLTIYEDGAPTNTAVLTGYTPAGTIPLDIGVGQPNNPNKLYPFKGRIQDVALYDHALDAATIQQHYLQGTT